MSQTSPEVPRTSPKSPDFPRGQRNLTPSDDSREGPLILNFVGAGVLHKFGADFFVFFLAFIFQREEIITPIFDTVFCTDFGVLIYAQVFVQIYCADFVRRFLRRFFVRNAQILAQIFAQVSADFSGAFWQLKNRCSRVTQKCAQNLRKNLLRPKGLSREGSLLHFRCLEQTACHTIAARHEQLRRVCERPSWHLRAQGPAFVCSKICQK